MLSSLLVAVLHTPLAHALDPVDDPTEATEATDEVKPQKTRDYLMEVNFRGRYLFLPDSLLNIWYETHEGETIERPKVHAYNLGLEFVVRNKKDNGIFYVDYLSSLIKPGYWDDIDSPPDYLDGEYIKPETFGLLMIGANYASEIHATPWFSVVFGAGLGVAIKTGNLVKWLPGGDENSADPTCGSDAPAYQRALGLEEGGDECAHDGIKDIPTVLPVLDINLGVRFNINDHASIRLEGGLHDLPYAGGSVGITF